MDAEEKLFLLLAAVGLGAVVIFKGKEPENPLHSQHDQTDDVPAYLGESANPLFAFSPAIGITLPSTSIGEAGVSYADAAKGVGYG